MLLIKIEKNENGSHSNVTRNFGNIPNGWAEVPSGIEIPDTFPFVNIEVENGMVTSMTAGVVPEPEPEPEQLPTLEERTSAIEAVLLAMMIKEANA